MFCQQCGKQTDDTAKFCVNCGAATQEPHKADTDTKEEKKEGSSSVLQGFGSLVGLVIGGYFLYQFFSGAAGPEANAAHILQTQMKFPATFAAQETKTMWKGVDKEGRDAYVVRVDYTAKNAMGLSAPGCQMVAFAIVGKKVQWNTSYGFRDCAGAAPQVAEALAAAMSSQFTE